MFRDEHRRAGRGVEIARGEPPPLGTPTEIQKGSRSGSILGNNALHRTRRLRAAEFFEAWPLTCKRRHTGMDYPNPISSCCSVYAAFCGDRAGIVAAVVRYCFLLAIDLALRRSRST